MKQWTEEKIKEGIFEVMSIAEIDTMPTNNLIIETTKSHCLSMAIQRNGGYSYWANKLGLKMTNCETRFGKSFEEKCIKDLCSFGYQCEQMTTRYPYDILTDFVKIDVKSGRLYNGTNGGYYTFNLEKSYPTCDIYVVYCVNDCMEIEKTYIIPAIVLQGKTQLSLGKEKSKYDIYIDRWDIIQRYNDFYKGVLKK